MEIILNLPDIDHALVTRAANTRGEQISDFITKSAVTVSRKLCKLPPMVELLECVSSTVKANKAPLEDGRYGVNRKVLRSLYSARYPSRTNPANAKAFKRIMAKAVVEGTLVEEDSNLYVMSALIISDNKIIIQ